MAGNDSELAVEIISFARRCLRKRVEPASLKVHSFLQRMMASHLRDVIKDLEDVLILIRSIELRSTEGGDAGDGGRRKSAIERRKRYAAESHLCRRVLIGGLLRVAEMPVVVAEAELVNQ